MPTPISPAIAAPKPRAPAPSTSSPIAAPTAPVAGQPTPVTRLEGDRYADAEVIEREGHVDNGQPGLYRQARLVRVTGEKYPLIVARDEVEVSPDGKSKLIKQQAMVADHGMLKLKPGVTDAALLAAIQKLGGTVRKKMPASRIWLIAFPKPTLSTVTTALRELAALPDVTDIVEPDYIVHANATEPSDTAFTSLWGLHNTGQNGGKADADIDAPEAWDYTTGSRSVLVGVIDTGIDHTHPDLAANMWINPNEIAANGLDDDNNGYVDDVRGWDFANNDNNPMDDHLHGTHCAGTIGGVGNNGKGVVGVCWQVSLVGLKFLSSSGSGTISDATEAVAYGTQIGVDMTSNSWGGGGYSLLLKSTIDAAGTANILFIAAAGNESSNSDSEVSYPSGYDSASIIAVAATTRSDVLSYFSNYGAATVDLAAPGSEIYSTAPSGGYATLSGTSMATPHVTGACALLLAHNPTLSPTAVKTALLSSVDPLPALKGLCVSGGRLNAARALQRSSELAVEPIGDFTFSMPMGGRAEVEGQDLKLTNYSAGMVTWNAEVDQAWVAMSGTATGTLAAGASSHLQLQVVSEEVALLSAGLHHATLTITDLSTGRSHARAIRLDLVPPALVDISLDTDPGWTRTGSWAYGVPAGGGGQAHGHPDPTHGATGAHVFGIDLDGDYSTKVGGPDWLTAGPFDLSQHKSIRLSFQRWLNCDYEPWVSAMIEVSTDGSQWTRVWRNGTTFITDASWRKMELDLSAIADRQASVWVRWGHQVDRSTNVWACSGWNLDDIQISGQLDRALTLIGPSEATEGEAAQTFTLQLHPLPTEPTTVALSASAADQVMLPESVTFAAGQGTATFSVQAADDALADGTQTVNLVATLAGWPAGQQRIEVHDNESSTLVLNLPGEVREGSINVFGSVSLAAPAERAVRVQLHSDDKTSISTPASVTIAAGQQSAAFPIIVTDDAFINPAQTVVIQASVANWPTATSTCTFVDDEPNELWIDPPSAVQENLAATFTGTVRVSGVLIAPLTVHLVSDDILRLTVPESITIPAGSSGRTFALTPGDDDVIDGLQQVQVTASAEGFQSSTGTVKIYDNETPALPGNPTPVDAQERTAPNAVLTWQGVPYTGGTPTSWDIYLGTTKEQALTRKVGSMNRRQWPLGRIQRGTTYYWRVVAKRGRASHAGPVWSFTIPSTGPPVRYAFSPIAAVQTVNQPFAVSLTAYDEFGNVATLDGGPVSFSSLGDGLGIYVAVAANNASTSIADTVRLTAGRWRGALRLTSFSEKKVRLVASNQDGDVQGRSTWFQVPGHSGRGFEPSASPSFTSESKTTTGAQIIVYLNEVTRAPLKVHLRSMDTTEALNGEALIPKMVFGGGSGYMPIVDDDVVDGPQSVYVEAWAPGWNSGWCFLQVDDNEPNPLTLSLPPSVNENSGTFMATVSVPHAPVNDVKINLSAPPSLNYFTILSVPKDVTLLAGQTSVTFPVTVQQNTVLDFDRAASITAAVPGWATGTASTLIVDDEPRMITVSLQPNLTEGAVKVSGGVGVSAPLLSKLTFNLTASDTSELSLPAQVSIPAGQAYASFDVAAMDDSELDGSQTVDITISAPGLTTKVQPFTVKDNDAHHFTFSALPETVLAGIATEVTVTAWDVNDEPLVLGRGPVNLSAAGDNGPVACTPTTLIESTGVGSSVHAVRLLSTDTNVRLKVTGPQGSSESAPFNVVRGPQAEVDPASLSLRVPASSRKTRPVTLSNPGTHDLIWSTSAADFLQVEPASGRIEPGASAQLLITASTPATSPYPGAPMNSQVVITSNDGLNRTLAVPVTMQAVSPVRAFQWSALNPNQFVNEPFVATLKAVDHQNQVVSDFEGEVTLTSSDINTREVSVDGADLTNTLLNPGSKTRRTQMIYHQAEVGSAGLLRSMSVDMAVLPNIYYRHMSVVIRLKHTSKSNSGEMNRFESDGWVTVFDSSLSLDATGWTRLGFTTPFLYNGTDNLMVDMTVSNTNYGSQSQVRGKTTSPWRVLTYYTNHDYGDPLSWTLGPDASNVLPNLRFEAADTLSPNKTSAFVNGVWTGDLTVTRPATNLLLTASGQTAQGLFGYLNVTTRGTATVALRTDLAEGQGTVANAGTITVSVPASKDTVFTLASQDLATLALPPRVTLRAGESSVSFSVTVLDDSLFEGDQPVKVTTTGTGYAQAEHTVKVADNDTTSLTLLLPTSNLEGLGSDTAGKVRLGTIAVRGAVVSLTSSSSRLPVATTVVIPAGRSETTFRLWSTPNDLLDGNETVTLTATCPGTAGTRESLLLQDDESLALLMTGPPKGSGISEGAPSPVFYLIYLGGKTVAPLTVTLESSDPAQCPSYSVIIPKGDSTAQIEVRAVDDDLHDGSKVITLTAKAESFISSAPAALKVWDNDPYSFSFYSPEFSSYIRGLPINVQVRPRDIDGGSINYTRMPEFVFMQDGQVLPHTVISAPANSSSSDFVATFAIDTYATSARLHVRDPKLGRESASLPFAVTHGPASSIGFTLGTTAPVAGQPFAVTLTALDDGDNVVPNFTEHATFHVGTQDDISVGVSGPSYTLWSPLGAANAAARTQMLFSKEELGQLEALGSLKINVSSKPASALNGYTIRVKPTSATQFAASDTFNNEGWTTVYSAPLSLSVIGWKTFPFQQRYVLDKTQNLLVDLSFQNTKAAAYNGSVYARQLATNHILISTGTSDPQQFSQGVGNRFRPDVIFGYGMPSLQITPKTTGAFVNGVWSGTVTVTPATKAVKLGAAFGDIGGQSPSFDLLPAAP